MATILLTGGAGYIGSHTWLALLTAGHQVVGVDDFSNSSPEVLNRIKRLSGHTPVFEQANVTERVAVDAIFDRHAIDAVVHFAAFKAVGESSAKPLDYYGNNLGSLNTVAQSMLAHGCQRIVFSSSATVYGTPEQLPIPETAALAAVSPYGQTKLVGEYMLRDLGAAQPNWQTATLRYFNPVGAHESGLMGEDPRGIPNNLMPYVAQVAVGRRPFLQVFGRDYDTPDGTGVRDYIHVADLAEGHVAALNYLLDGQPSITVNLGTGIGYSVLDVIKAYEQACGKPIAHQFAPRRAGDVASCFADARLAAERLGWHAKRDLQTMCADSWRWQSTNPNGYAG